MFTSLKLESFKAFEQVKADIRPITIFIGPNNSGKSSILGAPKLLAQTIISFDRKVPLLLNGVFGDFGTYKDVIHSHETKKLLKINFNMMVDAGPPRHGDSSESRFKDVGINLIFKYRPIRKEIILNKFQISTAEKLLLETKYSEDSERQLLEKVGKFTIPVAHKSLVSDALDFRKFIPFTVLMGRLVDRLKETAPEIATKLEMLRHRIWLATDLSNSLYRQLAKVEYVGAMRIPPARTYLYSGERAEKVGASGENAINILVMDSLRKGIKSNNILDSTKKWLINAGLVNDIKIESISDRYYEVHLQHPDSQEYSNFADVGYGISQIIPVLVAGYNLPSNSTLIIEEPEIHLHPRAQAELGSYFFDLYKSKKQSLIETHSEHLILRLQQYVANGDINPKDIVFYYVHSEDKNKTIKKFTLDELGRFKEPWPNGFFPDTLIEATKLSKIRAMKRHND